MNIAVVTGASSGIGLAQGHLFARPMPPEEMKEFVIMRSGSHSVPG